MRTDKDIDYIYQKFHKLVSYLCYKKLRANKFLEEKEVLSEGFYAFTRVINAKKFDPYSELAKSYICLSVARKLNDLTGKYIKKFKHEIQDGEIYSHLNKLNKNVSSNDLDKNNDIDYMLFILSRTNTLSDLQKTVIKWKYYHGMTKSEISRELNISRQRVYQIDKAALREIRIIEKELS